jgi:hypothetical protein
MRSRLDDLELRDGARAHPLDFGQPPRLRGDGLNEGAETIEQGLREWLHVAARDGPKKNQFEKFVFSERRRATFH